MEYAPMSSSKGQIAELKLGSTQQIWKALGPSLYTMRPLFPITVREMFQNSIDAQDAKGVDAPVEFCMKQDEVGDIWLSCVDKGIGMTEDVILEKFLALGESGKRDGASNVGGFGIAKSSIIGACASWKLHTHNLYLDASMIGVCPVSRDSEEYDGCSLTLKYDYNEENVGLKFDYGTVAHALRYLATSSRASNFVIEKMGKSVAINFDGLKTDERLLISTINCDSYDAKLYLIPAISFDYFESYPTSKDSEGFSSTNSVKGQLIYRLNGLTQFIQYGGNSEFNIVVEVTSNVLPGDLNYPFSSSRENAKHELRYAVGEKTKTYFSNPITTSNAIDNIINNVNEQKIKYYDGDNVEGGIVAQMLDMSANAVVTEESSDEDDKVEKVIEAIGENLAEYPELDATFVINKTPKLTIEDAAMADMIEDFRDELVKNAGKSPVQWKMCIKYRNEAILNKLSQKKYAKILRIWTELLQDIMACNPNVANRFAIGFITDEKRMAERYYDYKQSTTYYLIDPTDIKVSGGLDTVMRMFQYAAHEVAHTYCSSHDENFTCTYHKICDNFMETFGSKKLRELGQLLRTGK